MRLKTWALLFVIASGIALAADRNVTRYKPVSASANFAALASGYEPERQKVKTISPWGLTAIVDAQGLRLVLQPEAKLPDAYDRYFYCRLNAGYNSTYAVYNFTGITLTGISLPLGIINGHAILVRQFDALALLPVFTVILALIDYTMRSPWQELLDRLRRR